MINKKAAELYILSKKSQDFVTTVLYALDIIKDSDLGDILKVYTEIKAGRLKVAEIISASELSASQKSQIEQEVTEEVKEKLIFLFSLDPNLLAGFVVKINDNLIDNSLLTKIRELEVK